MGQGAKSPVLARALAVPTFFLVGTAVGTAPYSQHAGQSGQTVLGLIVFNASMAIPDHLLDQIISPLTIQEQIPDALKVSGDVVTTELLLAWMNQPVTHSTQTVVGRELHKLGWVKSRIRTADFRGYIYRPPVA